MLKFNITTICLFIDTPVNRSVTVLWQVGKARTGSRSPLRTVVDVRSSSLSPIRGVTRSRSPGNARSSCAAVEATLDQRRRQISELKTRVTGAGNRAASLRERADTADCERKRLEQELGSIKEELDHSSVIQYSVTSKVR